MPYGLSRLLLLALCASVLLLLMVSTEILIGAEAHSALLLSLLLALGGLVQVLVTVYSRKRP